MSRDHDGDFVTNVEKKVAFFVSDLIKADDTFQFLPNTDERAIIVFLDLYDFAFRDAV